MRFSLGLPLLLLAGCAGHVDTAPPVQHVYCVTPEQYRAIVQAEPAKIGQTLDKDVRVQNKQLTEQNILVRSYADGLLQIIGGCMGS